MSNKVYKNSMKELVDQALSSIPVEVVDSLGFDIENDYLFSPFILQMAYLKEQSEEEFLSYIAKLPSLINLFKEAKSINKNGFKIKFVSDMGMFPYTMARAIKMRDKAVFVKGSDFVSGLDWEQDDIIAFENAIDILFEAVPTETEKLISSNFIMMMFDLEKSIGFVDIAASGCIFIRKKELENVYRLAENILHEGSHNLFNLWVIQNIPEVLEETQLYTTPLRKDPRPIIGLLHQLYVLEKLYLFWNSPKLSPLAETQPTKQKLLEQIEACRIALANHPRWDYIQSIWP